MITDPMARNVLWYIAIALGGAILATGVQFGVMLSGPGEIVVRPLAATFVTALFGTLVTVAGAAFRPKAGREDISALVSEVGPGPAQAALEVAAVKQATGVTGLTPEQLAQMVDALHGPVADALEARMQSTPADPLVSKPPTWLPSTSPSAPIGPPPPPPDFDWNTR